MYLQYTYTAQVKRLKLTPKLLRVMKIGKGRQFIPSLPMPYIPTYQNEHSYYKTLGLREEKEVQFNQCSRQRNSSTIYPTPINSAFSPNPHQGSKAINSPSHPRMTRDVMLVIPLGFLQGSYWNTSKGTYSGKPKGVNSDPH